MHAEMFGRFCRPAALGLLMAVLLGCGQHYEAGSHPPPKPPPQVVLPQEGSPDGSEDAPAEKPPKAAEAVSGTVRIAPELAAKIPKNAYLFIIAREEPDGGAPYAFKRLRVPQFPFQYVLSQADVMGMVGEGAVFADIPEMYLVAKIDRDGRVGAAQPGDMEGTCSRNPVKVGQSGRDILIDRVH